MDWTSKRVRSWRRNDHGFSHGDALFTDSLYAFYLALFQSFSITDDNIYHQSSKFPLRHNSALSLKFADQMGAVNLLKTPAAQSRFQWLFTSKMVASAAMVVELACRNMPYPILELRWYCMDAPLQKDRDGEARVLHPAQK